MTGAVRCIAFVDLDDTLFSSARKQRDTSDLLPAALLRSGDVISYSNPAQRGLRQLLEGATEVIPVTARDVASYRRVLLRFAGRAVLSYGATILLPDGRIDTDWAAHVAPLLARARDDLAALAQQAAGCDPRGTRLEVRLVSDGTDPAYLVIRQSRNDTGVLHEAGALIAQWLAQHPGFKLHANGRILAIIPPGLGKEVAVAYLIERERRDHGTLFTLGAGDSLSDLDFMRLCDVAIVPGRTQLADALAGGVTQGREHHHQQLAIGQFGN